jgi:hypothetical protein
MDRCRRPIGEGVLLLRRQVDILVNTLVPFLTIPFLSRKQDIEMTEKGAEQ